MQTIESAKTHEMCKRVQAKRQRKTTGQNKHKNESLGQQARTTGSDLERQAK